MEKTNQIDFLLVGDTTWPMYVNAFHEASKSIKEADIFDFGILNSGRIGKSIILRSEYRFAVGFFAWMINRKLQKRIREKKYKYIFFYSARIVHWKTVKMAHDNGATVAVYCNDDPYSGYFQSYFWRNIRKSVKYSDITYSYRINNISNYQRSGANNVRLLRGYYNEDRSYKLDGSSIDIYVPKVVFLGHYENDERAEYLDALLDNNVEIGVSNVPDWKNYAQSRENVHVFEETVENYNAIINKAEIAIVFLSKINHDTYTRRCFEIPATGTLMVAPFNEDLASLFEDGKEAVFYRDKREFVDKILYYLSHPVEGREIGEKGRLRLLRDGHGAKDRFRQILSEMIEQRESNT